MLDSQPQFFNKVLACFKIYSTPLGIVNFYRKWEKYYLVFLGTSRGAPTPQLHIQLGPELSV